MCWPALLLFMAASALQAETAAERSNLLKNRAEQRWQLLIDRKFDAAYEFQSPAYREVHPVQQFTSGFGTQGRWLSAKVVDVAVEDARSAVGEEVLMVGGVTVELDYLVPFPSQDDPTRANTTVEERWLFVDGQWWYGK